MIGNEQLVSWNGWGVFAGPEESDEEFLRRGYSYQIEVDQSVVARQEDQLLERLFKVTPSWIKVELSSKGLLPWEGAMTFIEETIEGVPTFHIHIRPRHFLPEVVAHEMVHAMRLKFSEHRFEEILAYQTSLHPFRRYFGPLFKRAEEVKLWIFLLSLAWFFPLTELCFDVDIPFGGWYAWAPSVTTLGFYTYRLVRSQFLFQRCIEQLKTAARAPEMALPIALRLTDKEIENFASASPGEISSYAIEQKDKSLRWRQIVSSYFFFDEKLSQS